MNSLKRKYIFFVVLGYILSDLCFLLDLKGFGGGGGRGLLFMKKHFMTTKDNSCLKFTHDVKIVVNVAENDTM